MTAGAHLDRSTLAVFAAGELPPTALVARLLRHLAELCPICAEEVVAAQAEKRRRGGGSAAELAAAPACSPVLTTAWKSARDRFSALEPEIEAGRHRAREILLHAPSERPALIAAAPGGELPGLVAALAAACESALPRSPAEAAQLAEMVLTAAQRLGPLPHGAAFAADRQAEAWLKLGEARHGCGDKEASEAALDAAERSAAEGSGEPLLAAEILAIRAALRRSGGRLDEALALVERAIDLYSAAGETGRQANLLIEKASLLGERGEAREGVAVVGRALALLDAAGDPVAAGRALALFLDLVEASWGAV